ncbi:MAG: hypothetical protein ACR2NB_05015 [Solirubrobacteraceae bacterium]
MILAASTQTSIAVAGLLLLVGSLTLVATRRFGVALALYVLYLGTLDSYLKLAVTGTAVTVLRTVLLSVIAAASILVVSTNRRAVNVPQGTLIIVGLVLIALVQIANPGNPNLIKPIGSLRQEIEFVPLFFLAYATVRREADLQTLMLLLLGVSVANGLANLVQFNISITQFADWGPGYRDRIYGVGGQAAKIFTDAGGTGRVRPFGLGADAGSGGAIGLLGAPAAVALILRPRATGFASAALIRGVAIAAVPGVVLAVVLSQTRAVIIATALALSVQALLTARRQLLPLILVGGVSLILGAVVLGQLTQGSGAQKLSRYSSITPGKLLSTAQEERGSSLALASTYADRYPFGAGLGGVGPSTGFHGAVRPTEKLNGETQFNVLILDVGVPGLLLVLAFARMVLARFRAIVRIENPSVQAQLAALAGGFAAVVVQFFSSSPLTTVPGAPFFWGAGGVLIYWLAPKTRRRSSTVA